VSQLQTFLGLVTYMGPFIANLSAMAEPLRKLLNLLTPLPVSVMKS